MRHGCKGRLRGVREKMTDRRVLWFGLGQAAEHARIALDALRKSSPSARISASTLLEIDHNLSGHEEAESLPLASIRLGHPNSKVFWLARRSGQAASIEIDLSQLAAKA